MVYQNYQIIKSIFCPLTDDWLQRLTPDGQKRVISSQELVMVSDVIGSSQLSLGQQMGFHEAKIQQIEMQYPYRLESSHLISGAGGEITSEANFLLYCLSKSNNFFLHTKANLNYVYA